MDKTLQISHAEVLVHVTFATFKKGILLHEADIGGYVSAEVFDHVIDECYATDHVVAQVELVGEAGLVESQVITIIAVGCRVSQRVLAGRERSLSDGILKVIYWVRCR